MPAPTFVSSSPTNGQTSVAKNASISLVFDVALDPASVSPATVVLTNLKLNQRVEAEVGLSADGKTVSIAPAGHLYPNTGYRIRIVGADTNATGCLKSATTESLALTLAVVFQTGDTLAADATVSDLEGDVSLPTDIGFVGSATAPLRLVGATPAHQAFAIEPAISQFGFRFSADVDPTSVTGNVTVRQTAFYAEEGFRARETDLANGQGLRHYFMAETGTYNSSDVGVLDPALFADRTYQLAIVEDSIYLIFDDEYSFPDNIAVEVILGSGIKDVNGNYLGEDLVWFGCTTPYPSWTSILAVRHQSGYEISSAFPDAYVGLRTWMATMDLLGEFNWQLPADNPNRYMQEYARTEGALEIWMSALEDKGVAAGTSKRLGDFEVSVNTAAGSARPAKMRVLEDRRTELLQYLWGGITQTPRIGIKSIMDPYEPGRGYFRNRLWRPEIENRRVSNLPFPAANTADERQAFYPESFLAGGTPTPGGAGTRHSL